MPLHRVTVRVPATTANLGPGFDCLGMALDIHNSVTVETGQGFGISISGEGESVLSRGRDNRVYQAISAAYQRAGKEVPDLRLACHNEIPLRRGLGSSAAAAVGGLVAANTLLDGVLAPDELVSLGTALEGHPDNVAAALLGGCQVAVLDGDSVVTASIPLPQGLVAVLYVPDFEMPTAEARTILPKQVSRADAVHNVARTALLVTALATGQLHYLRLATQDRLHQPARQALFPAMGAIFEAALAAGALGVFLSGGGSTVLALAQGGADAIAEAMSQAAAGAGLRGYARVAQPSMAGAQVVAER